MPLTGFQAELGLVLAKNRSEDSFIAKRPPEEAGCLYFDPGTGNFVNLDDPGHGSALPHYGRPGGVLPRMAG